MKRKFILVFCAILLIAIVAATFYPEPWGNDVDAGGYDLNNLGTLNADNIVGNITGEVNWTNLENYPSACPGSSAVTTLGDSATCSDLWVDVAGDNMTGDLQIQDVSDLGSEIHTDANAVSDPNGNEADALTGWTTTGGPLASQTNNPYVGTYQMMDESADANDNMEYSFTVVDGQTYRISFAVKRGSQGTTQEVSGWEGFTTDPTINISSTSWTEYELYLLANSTSAKIKVHSAVGGAAADKVHLDNVSIRQVQGGDLDVTGDVHIRGNLYLNNTIGMTGNYSVGSCWVDFIQGMAKSTNCTAL